MNVTQYKPALLDAPSDNIMMILEKKAAEKGVEAMVDYIGFTDDLLKDKIERLKSAKTDIDAMLKATAGQQQIIKIEAARFLSANGVESLKGDTISSVKVNTKAPTKKLVIDDEDAAIEAGYYTKTIDKKALQADIESGKEFDFAHIETTHNEDQITIYRRKQS